MNKIKLLIYSFLLLGCAESKKVDKLPSIIETSDLQVSSKLGEPITELDEHFDFLDLISLQTPEGIVISEITKVMMDDSGIFVHDKKFEGLYHFDLDGNYLKSYGTLGEGPGEFLDISDFEIKEDEIVILSKSKKGLLFFDKESGGFLDEKRYDLFGDELVYIDNDEFLVYVNFNANDVHGSYNVFRIDSEGSILQKYFPFDEEKQHSMVSMSGYLTESAGDVYFGLPFDEFVFSYNKDEQDFYPKYQTDLLSQYILDNKRDFDAILKPEVLIKSFGGESFNGTTYLENKRKIYLTFFDLSSKKSAIVDKKTGEVSTISYNSTNLFFQLLDDPLIMTENDELVFPIYGEKMVDNKYFASSGNSEFLKKVMNKRESLGGVGFYYLLKTKIL